MDNKGYYRESGHLSCLECGGLKTDHEKNTEMMCPSPYAEKREKVMQSDLDVFAAREVAYAWHGGQGSALYSFASTDCTVWSEEHRASLLAEIDRAISLATAEPLKYYAEWADVDTYTRERISGTPEKDWGAPHEAGLESLDSLRAVVVALPAKKEAEDADTYQKLARDINKGPYRQEGRWVLRKPEDDRCMVVASDYPSRYPPKGIVAEGPDWATVAKVLEQYRRES